VGRAAAFFEAHLGRGRDPGLELRALDAGDPVRVREAMGTVDAVLCELPYSFNYQMAELAVDAGVHYCDLGGNTEIVEQQRGLDARAARAGISVIPDCGVAPGMVNILAQGGIDALDRVASVRMFVGGLPQRPKPPLNYQIVYSMQGVLDYYTTPSVVLENGELATKEALSEVEEVCFPEPVERLEAFHTAGGASTMPYRYRGRIPRLEYKTLRYPGHAHIMRAIRDLGLFTEEPHRIAGCEVSPRDFFIEVVSPKLRGDESPDLVALRVEVTGEKGGARKVIRFDLLDRYDEAHGITAMMRTTGYSLAVTTLMQVDGRVKEYGVRTPDEAIPLDSYISERRARGIAIERTEP
ncbi:MAG: saccharopine dehydrogenase, partial [Gemmatimonadetes bacterium]|nr:saccharopine dehydrogenase [Gemmatimonadota bacterium]